METFSPETHAVIKKFCKGKKHMKLIVGTLLNGETNFMMFDAKGEIPFESCTIYNRW